MPSSKYFNNNNAPDGIRIEHNTQGLHIIRYWSKAAGCFMLVWVAVWLGMVGFLFSLGGHSLDWFALIPALPALIMSYAAMTRFFNYTLIDVTPSRLLVRHKPLLWSLSKHFATHDIHLLCAAVKKVYAKGGIINVYQVMIIRQDGKKKVLLSGLEMSESQMNFIVDAINEYLRTVLNRG